MAHLAELLGYTLYGPTDTQGFFLPVFRQGEDGPLLLQVPDCRSSLIDAFVKVSDLPITHVHPVKQPIIARAGDPLIYCFCVDDGEVVSGSLHDLQDPLRLYLSTGNDDAVKLQIAELIGSIDDVHEQRSRFTNIVSEISGVAASTIFGASSLFLMALWRALLEHVTDEQLEVLDPRQRWVLLGARPGQPSLFTEPVASWLSLELGLDVTSFAEIVRHRLKHGYASAEGVQGEAGFGAIEKEVQAILESGTEESQVARLIRVGLENPELGPRLLDAVEQGSGTLKRAIKVLRPSWGRFETDLTPEFGNFLVQEMYAIADASSKGRMLFELANYLSRHGVFAVPILVRAQCLNSPMVKKARLAIEERIQDPSDEPREFRESLSGNMEISHGRRRRKRTRSAVALWPAWARFSNRMTPKNGPNVESLETEFDYGDTRGLHPLSETR